jgi:hypothetical protein
MLPSPSSRALPLAWQHYLHPVRRVASSLRMLDLSPFFFFSFGIMYYYTGRKKDWDTNARRSDMDRPFWDSRRENEKIIENNIIPNKKCAADCVTLGLFIVITGPGSMHAIDSDEACCKAGFSCPLPLPPPSLPREKQRERRKRNL